MYGTSVRTIKRSCPAAGRRPGIPQGVVTPPRCPVSHERGRQACPRAGLTSKGRSIAHSPQRHTACPRTVLRGAVFYAGQQDTVVIADHKSLTTLDGKSQYSQSYSIDLFYVHHWEDELCPGFHVSRAWSRLLRTPALCRYGARFPPSRARRSAFLPIADKELQRGPMLSRAGGRGTLILEPLAYWRFHPEGCSHSCDNVATAPLTLRKTRTPRHLRRRAQLAFQRGFLRASVSGAGARCGGRADGRGDGMDGRFVIPSHRGREPSLGSQRSSSLLRQMLSALSPAEEQRKDELSAFGTGAVPGRGFAAAVKGCLHRAPQWSCFAGHCCGHRARAALLGSAVGLCYGYPSTALGPAQAPGSGSRMGAGAQQQQHAISEYCLRKQPHPLYCLPAFEVKIQ
ncbi:hypothetical protein AAFF_G00376720 [Aldrovandia affinis]|uniref:Uncharacterized protein n=1 Tax=Aldrovandia affinis TaxID=143900 RepID=A0AAD7SFN3_9TELE|nr:hypothetical protein AAFF_G00376720 [Aldrovandia affinis]